MNIAFGGTLTQADYIKAYREMVRPLYTRIIPIIALLVLASFLVPTLLSLFSDDPPPLTNLWIFGVVFLVMVGAFFFSYRSGGINAWKMLPSSVRLPVQGEISETGMIWNTEVGETTFKWAAFTHYVKTGDMILLYQGAAATLLPRAFFADEAAWNAAVALIQSHVSATPRKSTP